MSGALRGRRVWAGAAVAVAAAALVAVAVGRNWDQESVDARDSGATTSPTSTTPAPSTSVPAAAAAPATAAPEGEPLPASYAFPIRPAEAADYPSSHHDYPAADIFAACGSAVVAPSAGTVQEVTLVDLWSSTENDPATRGGVSFAIVGDDGVRYYGSHLARLEPSIVPGARVATGTPLGDVGRTGNAAGTPCHLHFGISTPCGPGDVLRRRGEFWPQPFLDDWAGGGQRSPADLADPASC